MKNVANKGNFVLQPRLDQKMPIAKIVKITTMEYLLNNIDPMETIKASNNPTDFIISANSTDFLNVTTGEELGYKAIRVVYSNSGSEFKALKNDNVNGGYKESVVLEGESLKFLEILPEDISELDINYDKYCYEAWKNIYTIIKPKNDNEGDYYLPKREEGVVDWKHCAVSVGYLYKEGFVKNWYHYLKSLGLTIFPKNVSKKNYAGLRPTAPETWDKIDPEKALGLSVVMDTCCSIDIDNPKFLDPSLKFLLEKYPTMKVYHGEDKVLNGGKGAFIYRTKEPLKLKSSGKMVDNLGFEFLNGENKVQTVFGVHPKCELYQIVGTPVELPQEIKDYLMGCKTSEGKRAIPRIMGTKKKVVVDNVLKVDERLVLDTLLEHGITVIKTKAEDEHLQCWDDNSHWFVVSRNQMNGTYYVNSNQTNFLMTLKSIFDGSF